MELKYIILALFIFSITIYIFFGKNKVKEITIDTKELEHKKRIDEEYSQILNSMEIPDVKVEEKEKDEIIDAWTGFLLLGYFQKK